MFLRLYVNVFRVFIPKSLFSINAWYSLKTLYSIILWLFIVNLPLQCCLYLKCKASFPKVHTALLIYLCYQKFCFFISLVQTERLLPSHWGLLTWNSLTSLEACQFVQPLARPSGSFSSPVIDNLAVILLPWWGGRKVVVIVVAVAATVYWPLSVN